MRATPAVSVMPRGPAPERVRIEPGAPPHPSRWRWTQRSWRRRRLSPGEARADPQNLHAAHTRRADWADGREGAAGC